MSTFREEIHPFRARRGETRDAFVRITDDQITATVVGRSDVRYLLWRINVAMNRRRVELAQTIAALGWRQTEAQRILGTTMESRGELRSLLLGVADEDIDVEPAPGEWSVRQVLEHAHTVDRRYMQAVQYAVERTRSADDLPLEQPRDGRPPAEDESLRGTLNEVLTKLHLRREEVVANLIGISDEEIAAPMVYRGDNVDVSYRLHLIAAHEREHTGQVARTLRAVGFQQSEAQMILGQTEQMRGLVEGMLIGIPDELLTRGPGGELPSVHDILANGVAEETKLADNILGAIAVK